MSATWVEKERAAIAERTAALKALSDENCRICHGNGTTRGWVAQGYVTYPCPCTGQADWQREETP